MSSKCIKPLSDKNTKKYFRKIIAKIHKLLNNNLKIICRIRIVCQIKDKAINQISAVREKQVKTLE